MQKTKNKKDNAVAILWLTFFFLTVKGLFLAEIGEIRGIMIREKKDSIIEAGTAADLLMFKLIMLDSRNSAEFNRMQVR